MKKITLDFFGEKTTISLPNTLQALRRSISEQFLFTPGDTAELVISYMKEFTKCIVNTEQDYKTLFNLGITQLSLDISENSRLYQEKKSNAAEDNSKLLSELTTMRQKTADEYAELESIKAQMNELKQQFNQHNKELNSKCFEQKKKIKDNEILIKSLEKALGIPHEPRKDSKHKKHEKRNCFKEEEGQSKEREAKKYDWRKHLKTEKGHSKEREAKKYDWRKHLKTEEGHQDSKDKERNKYNWRKHLTVEGEQDDCIEQHHRKFSKKHEHEGERLDFDGKHHRKFEKGWKKKDRKEEDKERKWLHKKDRVQTERNIFERHKELSSKSRDKVPNLSFEEQGKEETSKEKDIAYHYIRCDGCKKYPIKGTRYQCYVCPNLDYCSSCEEKNAETHKHPFVCFRKPTSKAPKDKHR